jgi:hypothetical protein
MKPHLLVSIVAAALFASPSAFAKPKAKAARVPPRPHLPSSVSPTIKQDVELGRAAGESAPAAPAQALTTLASTIGGRYKCSGTIANEGGGERTTAARMKVGSSLDGYWLAFDLDETASDAAPFPEKLHIVRTYDEGARAWTSVAIDNRGRMTSETADHGDEQAVTWLGTSHRDGDRVEVRTHDERDDRAGTIRLWSELSRDGKTYEKQYDFTCSKQ